MNIWIDKVAENDKDTNRIGYGFYINPETEQLELFKYKRYSYMDANSNLQAEGKTQYRKVSRFGFGVMDYAKDSDLIGHDPFAELDAVYTRAQGLLGSQTSSNELAPSTADGVWAMDSNANISYTGMIGVNTDTPAYELDVVGSIQASDTVISTSFVTASDARVKTDITRLSSELCLEKVRQLAPTSYNLISDNSRKSGFIAQEVKEVIPESIEIKENTTASIDDFHFLDYNGLLAYLVGAVQELDAKVAMLTNQTRATSRFMRF
jgi:hypothetical protein